MHSDSTVATLFPNAYQELSVPLHATEFCADGSCVQVLPSMHSVSYVACSLSDKDELAKTQLEVVKPKVGSFYIKEIKHLQEKQ